MVWWARPSHDEAERKTVNRLAGARKAPRDLVVRAQLVQLSWSGQRVPVIASELGCSPNTVRCWLHRFNRTGVAGMAAFGTPDPLAGFAPVPRGSGKISGTRTAHSTTTAASSAPSTPVAHAG